MSVTFYHNQLRLFQSIGNPRQSRGVRTLSVYQESIMFIVGLLPDILVYGSQRIKPPDTAPSRFSCSSLLLFFCFCFCNGFFYLKLAATWFASNSSAGRAVRHVTDLLCTKTRHFISLSKGDSHTGLDKISIPKIASKVPKSSNALEPRSYTMQCKGCIRPLY